MKTFKFIYLTVFWLTFASIQFTQNDIPVMASTYMLLALALYEYINSIKNLK